MVCGAVFQLTPVLEQVRKGLWAQKAGKGAEPSPDGGEQSPDAGAGGKYGKGGKPSPAPCKILVASSLTRDL